jgi:isoleucyl-tRNA synthetase
MILIFTTKWWQETKESLDCFHDGPPFSNGHIHMGTAMNKSLKYFIDRYKNMTDAIPTYPGWDNHGMPIESAIIKQNNWIGRAWV